VVGGTQVIYSVYRPETGVYDYYETPEQTAKNPDPQFLTGRGATAALGLSSTDAGWQLPGNARKVGEGKQARGMIATRNGGSLGGFEVPGGGFGVAAILGGLWWLFGGRKRR